MNVWKEWHETAALDTRGVNVVRRWWQQVCVNGTFVIIVIVSDLKLHHWVLRVDLLHQRRRH